MHIAISFKTSMFDVSKENKNPVNPIYGESLLKWLKQELDSEFEFTEPDAEDWGWYSYITWNNRQYMLGASTYFEEGDDPKSELEWVFQIDKPRSLKEKLLGREKISTADDCVLFFKSKFEAQPEMNSVVFE
ncbi:hypothetical protein EXT48_16970 [Pseudoalteromonas sp. CO348]|uniref:hypothetical protein n=1 Tax=unclassified Pseudoalteromonas TaxID=194690 RepID=UPI0010237D65|nr:MULTISPECIES: hypothetical protein [unclassified Pseudoalteromonas]MCG7541073.1 hypothetical protein [Pseudoalteromonas sp. OF7H-1]RZG01019.1 hypothetical protein EXT48_16970 [Pseudoalteromonas sp. CO348]